MRLQQKRNLALHLNLPHARNRYPPSTTRLPARVQVHEVRPQKSQRNASNVISLWSMAPSFVPTVAGRSVLWRKARRKLSQAVLAIRRRKSRITAARAAYGGKTL